MGQMRGKVTRLGLEKESLSSSSEGLGGQGSPAVPATTPLARGCPLLSLPPLPSAQVSASLTPPTVLAGPGLSVWGALITQLVSSVLYCTLNTKTTKNKKTLKPGLTLLAREHCSFSVSVQVR